jgi:hypothetical protein
LCGNNKKCPYCYGSGSWKWDKCIYNYLDKNAETFWDTYNHFKSGIMPYSGGYIQQSHNFVINAKYMDRALDRYKQELQKRNGR